MEAQLTSGEDQKMETPVWLVHLQVNLSVVDLTLTYRGFGDGLLNELKGNFRGRHESHAFCVGKNHVRPVNSSHRTSGVSLFA